MRKIKTLYIVICGGEKGPLGFFDDKMIGYLPGVQVPKSSILWDALTSGDEAIRTDGGWGIGFEGIYEKKKLAEEHMKIEKKWRYNTSNFKIVEI